MNPPGPSGRKRVISESEEPDDGTRTKRSRIQSPPLLPPTPTRTPTRSPATSITRRTYDYDRFTMPLRDSDGERNFVPHTRPLSTSSSMSTPGTPAPSGPMQLMRSASFSSFHSQASVETSTIQPYYPEGSAKYCLRDSRLAIDFSLPSTSDKSMPLCYSSQNQNLYFSRGNRVFHRNMVAADNVSQLCKLQDKHGDLILLEAGASNLLALATSKGIVQVWDTNSRKMACSWTTKGVASLAWNGHILSVGGTKGTIRHYDTRIQPTDKMKEQASKVTRHQASIATLAWNTDGKLLASGDESGIVYTWDARSKVPLDVGEFHQRRKKIQHTKAISSKLLATGDLHGTVKFWTVEPANPHSNATAPGKIELGSKIELLTTLGPIPTASPEAIPSADIRPLPRSILSNSITVHSFPSLRPIASVSVSEKDVCGSVLNTGSAVHKIVVAVPDESKLKVFDVWGKRKEIRRQASSLGNSIR
ncbi:Cell division cycle protein 20 [Mycena venus]|uniref:Cell division cycle protein 20 n=1 Tax=Mycena venus TaxID=2733690 RepID=A0A8H6Z342_9AGAR|nr:Cell division cycle protein 20 [Mycena venus]